MSALQGRHALVTGGGGGIGRAVAAMLADAGCAVTVLGRSEAPLREAVAQGHAAAYVAADVTDAVAIGEAVRRATEARGPIDIMVASAGGAEAAPFARADADMFRRMFDLNVVGVVNTAQAVLDGMMARGFGRIVAIASTAGLKGYGYVSAYCASKHAVVGLVRSLAVETASSGVTVNAVCPGYTDTDLVRESLGRIAAKTGRSHEDALTAMLKSSPLGRLVQPHEVAAAVLYLCSPDASAVTGTTLAVAGGEV